MGKQNLFVGLLTRKKGRICAILYFRARGNRYNLFEIKQNKINNKRRAIKINKQEIGNYSESMPRYEPF